MHSRPLESRADIEKKEEDRISPSNISPLVQVQEYFSRASKALLAATVLTIGSVRAEKPVTDGQTGIIRADLVSAERVVDPQWHPLIDDLGSPDWQTRERAQQEINELLRDGADPILHAAVVAARSHPDHEIRMRALQLDKEVRRENLWAGSKVTCAVNGEPVSKVIALLRAQTGIEILLGDQYGDYIDGPVTLDYTDAPFWLVLDDICRQTGNQVPQNNTKSQGLVLVAGEPGLHPVAYEGPIRAHIINARRDYREEMNMGTGSSEVTHTFQLNCQMQWEDTFRPVAYRLHPEVVKVVTDTGAQLAATQLVGSSWSTLSRGTRGVTLNARLEPPSIECDAIETLVLRWGILAVGDYRTMEINNLKPEVPHLDSGIEVVVESLVQKPGNRYEIAVIINRDLIIPDPQEVLLLENDVALLDQEGRPFRRQGQTNSLIDSGAKLRLTFVGEQQDSVPTSLLVSYPQLRDQRFVDIEFTNIPIPSKSP